MGIISGFNSSKKEVQPGLILTTKELDCVINALAVSHFPVRDIESLYSAIVKIQEYRKTLDNAT
jgi:hypothetical protein